ncbi:hypothetical protein ACFSUK_15115 [Sphingobium scionense]
MSNGSDKLVIASKAPLLARVDASIYRHAPDGARLYDRGAGLNGDQGRFLALEQEVADVRNMLSVKEAEIARLQVQVQQYERSLADRDARLAIAQDVQAASDRRLGQHAEQVRMLTASQEMLLQNRHALDEAKDGVERELRGARQELEKAANDIAWIGGEKDGLRRDLAAREAGLDQLEAERQALAAAKREADANVDVLTVELTHLRDEASKSWEVVDRLYHVGDVQGDLPARGQGLADAILQAKLVLEGRLREAHVSVAEREARIALLTQDIDAKAEQFASQNVRLVAAKAKQALLGQERDVLQEELENVRKELSGIRDRLNERDDEVRHFGEFAQSKADELAKREEELTAAHLEVSLMRRQMKEDSDRLEARQVLLGGQVTRQNAELGQLQLNILQMQQLIADGERALRDAEAGEQEAQAEVAARNAELTVIKGQLGQTQSALAQRQLETEETVEALRRVLADRDELIQRERDNEFALNAHVDKIALLEETLVGARGNVDRLRASREELAGRIEGVYDEFSRLVELLLGRGVPAFLPRSLRLRRQAMLLGQIGLFDRDWYLSSNMDVLESGLDPQTHFLEYGLREGRSPNQQIDDLRRSRIGWAVEGAV